jgi:SAM-dependent methyltransferase
LEHNEIRKTVEGYYTAKVRSHGPTPKGVDWNSSESQELRFQQLTTDIDFSQPFSINDFGCGYGALVDYLEKRASNYSYFGFDLSKDMINIALDLHKELSNCKFFSEAGDLATADYTVASGIFNVRMEFSNAAWLDYMLKTIDALNSLSSKGFSFNALTKYSDAEYMRSDLYYADPTMLFDYCKKNYSKYVTLLHDYPLYEFTIRVRKEN